MRPWPTWKPLLVFANGIDYRTDNTKFVLTSGEVINISELASDSDLLTAFFLDCRYRLRPATLKCYHDRLYFLLNLAHKHKTPLAALTSDNIKSYLFDLSESNLSIETINGRIRVFKLFYNYLFSEELIPENPTTKIKLIPTNSKLKPILSTLQLNLFLKHWSHHTFTHQRNRCTSLVLLDSMIRVGELVNILLKHVDLVGGTIYIPNSKTHRDRTVPISTRTAKAIHRYLVKYRKQLPYHLFPNVDGSQQQPLNVSRTFNRASHCLGFTVYPHLLRHTGATYLINAGMSDGICQRILGHSDIRTTMIYHHPDQQAIKQQHDRFSVVSNLNKEKSYGT